MRFQISSSLALPLLGLAACTPGDTPIEANEAPSFESALERHVAAVPESNSVDDDIREIPAGFRGVWFGLESICTEYAQMRIEIMPASIQYYESRGMVTAIDRTTGQGLRIALDMTGEGDSWKGVSVWSLEENGKILVRKDEGEGADPDPIRYHRCTT